jgi:hypothetical protein
VEIDPSNLLSWQIPAATQLLRTLNRNGSALDGSDMGTGKTYVSAAVAKALAVPTLVVCPQISITAWHRCAEFLGTEYDALNYEMLRTGNTPFGQWEHPRPKVLEKIYECTECQLKIDFKDPFPCPHRRHGIHCVKTKTKSHKHGKFIWHEGVKLLIFDEVHRAGGTDSLNADLLSAAKRQGIKTLCLSATAADSPLNFKSLGYVLGLHALIDRNGGEQPGFWRWAGRMGCRKSPFGGLAFLGNENFRRIKMAQLNTEIFPSRGIRVKISDLPPGTFPDVQIRAELYDLPGWSRVNELYEEMSDALRELESRKAQDIDLEHPLTRLLRAKQEIELLKAPVFEELTKQGIENNRTVGVFVNFTQTLDELSKRLKTDCRIDGSQVGVSGHRRRQEFIDRVQADKERIILLNSQAGGVSISLQDLTGRFPRLGLVSLPNSASMFRQLCGRFPRAGGKSPSLYRIILAAGTCEEGMHKRLSEKLNQMDALNDGDLWATNLPPTRRTLDEIFNLTGEKAVAE